jgi:hypothetical protein
MIPQETTLKTNSKIKTALATGPLCRTRLVISLPITNPNRGRCIPKSNVASEPSKKLIIDQRIGAAHVAA